MSVQVLLEKLAPDHAGVLQTIARMQERVADALLDTPPPGVADYVRTWKCRRAAEWVLHTAAVPRGHRPSEARAIYCFNARTLDYVRDPSFMEFIVDPRVLIARIDDEGWAAEDCDGHAVLAATLGAAVRLPMRFVLVDRGGEFCHVYAAMQTGAISRAWRHGDDAAESGLLSLDTASPEAGFGLHAPASARLVVPCLPGS